VTPARARWRRRPGGSYGSAWRGGLCRSDPQTRCGQCWALNRPGCCVNGWCPHPASPGRRKPRSR